MIAQSRIAGWYETRDGLAYLREFFQDMNRKHRPEGRRDSRLLAGLQVQMIRQAEPIYVSADVTEIIDHARQTFEPEPVRPNDPWVKDGFALLPRPILLPDGPQTIENPWRSALGEIPIRAIGWTCSHSEDYSIGAHWISYYVDINDEIEQEAEDPDVAEHYRREREEIREMYVRRSWPPLQLVHQFQWSWGSNPWTDGELDVLPGDDEHESRMRGKAQSQLVQTLWRIGSQMVPAKERPPRPMRRERRRRGFAEDVTVIRLRRSGNYRRPDNETDRRLTVRHLVRGYWARRHFRDGTRQVWVRPHIRGDESLPLVLTTRAWEFTR